MLCRAMKNKTHAESKAFCRLGRQGAADGTVAAQRTPACRLPSSRHGCFALFWAGLPLITLGLQNSEAFEKQFKCRKKLEHFSRMSLAHPRAHGPRRAPRARSRGGIARPLSAVRRAQAWQHKRRRSACTAILTACTASENLSSPLTARRIR